MTPRPRVRTNRVARAARVGVVTAALGSFGLAGCAGGSDPAPTASPADAIALAVQHLTSTSGVRLTLATTDTPSGESYLTSADGVVTDTPAFQGTATGSYKGIPAQGVGVISVGGTFYVDVPLGGWTKLDPKALCAPDPADLLDADDGVPHVLTEATGLAAGSPTRGGTDNKQTLTPYTGTVPAAAVRSVLPCAGDGTYQGTFTVDSDGFLRSAELTGDFSADGSSITYRIDVGAYDVTQDITAP